jgi:hypothetical protein
VELWRIGNSATAPKFNVVSKPNDWTRSISGAAHQLKETALTETQKLQLEYWTAFRELLIDRGGVVNPTKPYPQGFYDLSIGRSGFMLEAFINTQDHRIGVILILGGDDAKPHFHLLNKSREKFENLVGELEWDEKPEGVQSQIKLRWHDCDPTVKDDWPEQHEWLYEKLQLFHQART